MKKYLSLLSIPALMTLNSCLQEDIVKNGGQEVTAKVNITLPGNGAQSRTVTGPEAENSNTYNGMRLCLFVYSGDEIVKTIIRDGKNGTSNVNFSGETTVTEEIRLVTGQPYKIAAWADFGDDYYTITDGFVSLADNDGDTNNTIIRKGNEVQNDAFYVCEDVKLEANKTIDLTLTRPFGLVQITTNDWNQDAVAKAGLRPDYYTTTITVPTKLNLLSGETNDPESVTFSGNITTTSEEETAESKKLSFDYIFAGSSEAELADFTMEYKQKGAESSYKEICDYTFTNIPVRKNYITNVSGNVLTKEGTLEIKIDQAWADPAIDKEVYDVTSTYELESVISSAISGKENVIFKVTGAVAQNDKVSLPAVNSNQTIDLVFDKFATNGTLTVEDNNSNVSGNINITVPQENVNALTIELPNAHVTVNGIVKEMTASTSATTLVVAKEATIETLTVKAGNVDIYGSVDNIKRHTENTNKVIVNLYDGAAQPTVSSEDESKFEFKEIISGQIVNKTTGKSYATIADAITAANSNDKIELAAATFDEVINIAKSDKVLTIVGQEGTKVKSCYLNGGNTTFENIEFYGASVSAGSFSTVFAGSSATVTLKNCVIDVTEQLGTENQGRPVETAYNAPVNFTMEGCTIKANNAKNVYLNPVAKNGSLTVKNCTFVDKALTAEFNCDANSAKVLPVLEGNDFGGNSVGFSYYADPKITDANGLDFATKIFCNNILENNTFAGENKIKVTPLPWASGVYFWVNTPFEYGSGSVIYENSLTENKGDWTKATFENGVTTVSYGGVSKSGEYRPVWLGNWTQRIDVYIDPEQFVDGKTNDQGVDGSYFCITSAVNTNTNEHKQDFVFGFLKYDGEIDVRLGNGTDSHWHPQYAADKEGIAWNIPEGWYTLEWKVFDNNGIWTVTSSIYNESGEKLGGRTLPVNPDPKNEGPVSIEKAGMNRYIWFTKTASGNQADPVSGIKVRNQKIVLD